MRFQHMIALVLAALVNCFPKLWQIQTLDPLDKALLSFLSLHVCYTSQRHNPVNEFSFRRTVGPGYLLIFRRVPSLHHYDAIVHKAFHRWNITLLSSSSKSFLGTCWHCAPTSVIVNAPTFSGSPVALYCCSLLNMVTQASSRPLRHTWIGLTSGFPECLGSGYKFAPAHLFIPYCGAFLQAPLFRCAASTPREGVCNNAAHPRVPSRCVLTGASCPMLQCQKHFRKHTCPFAGPARSRKN